VFSRAINTQQEVMVTQYYLPIGLHCNRAEGVYIETKSDTTWKHIFHIPYVKLE